MFICFLKVDQLLVGNIEIWSIFVCPHENYQSNSYKSTQVQQCVSSTKGQAQVRRNKTFFLPFTFLFVVQGIKDTICIVEEQWIVVV